MDCVYFQEGKALLGEDFFFVILMDSNLVIVILCELTMIAFGVNSKELTVNLAVGLGKFSQTSIRYVHSLSVEIGNKTECKVYI